MSTYGHFVVLFLVPFLGGGRQPSISTVTHAMSPLYFLLLPGLFFFVTQQDYTLKVGVVGTPDRAVGGI